MRGGSQNGSRKRRKYYLSVVGYTSEKDLVVKGVFDLISTRGLPLDMVIEELCNQGIVIDWFDFYESSIKGGWKPNTAITKIQSSVGDILGEKEGNEIIKRLKIATSRIK